MADHLHIGSKAAIGAKSGLMHDVPEGQKMFGIPARAARDEMLILANRAKLPEMRKAIKHLEKELSKLQQQLAAAPGDERKVA
jgi:UDP-3-O-[3-hydroxymyristoyl] glucosamine N-acyltransferase